jgi:acyl-CoA thioester hydrolase
MKEGQKAASDIFSYSFTVEGESIDFNGHVGNVTYLAWMVEAATRHAAHAGWDMHTCIRHGGTWVAKNHCIDYLRPAFAGDTLTMRTWLEEIGKIKAIRRYEILKEGRLLAKGRSEWIYVDAENFRPIRIPEKMAEEFRRRA